MERIASRKALLALHIMIMVYSLSGVCSKMASSTRFLSLEFCFYYCIIVILLGLYAVGWQQIIRKMELTTAFASKSLTLIWGLVWGKLFFEEKISIWKVVGAIIVVLGVVLYSTISDESDMKKRPE